MQKPYRGFQRRSKGGILHRSAKPGDFLHALWILSQNRLATLLTSSCAFLSPVAAIRVPHEPGRGDCQLTHASRQIPGGSPVLAPREPKPSLDGDWRVPSAKLSQGLDWAWSCIAVSLLDPLRTRYSFVRSGKGSSAPSTCIGSVTTELLVSKLPRGARATVDGELRVGDHAR